LILTRHLAVSQTYHVSLAARKCCMAGKGHAKHYCSTTVQSSAFEIAVGE